MKMKFETMHEDFRKLTHGKEDPFNTDHLKMIFDSVATCPDPDRTFYAVYNALTVGYVVGYAAATGKKKRPEKIGSSD